MAFEHPVDRLVMSDEIRHRLSAAAVCRAMRGFIHDYGPDTYAIAGAAQVLLDKYFTEDVNPAARRLVETILRTAERHATGHQALAMVWERPGRGHVVGHLKSTVTHWFRYYLARSRTTLDCRWPEEELVHDGAGGLGRILFHVMSNALIASSLGESRRVVLDVDLDTRRIATTVSDSGPGIDMTVMDTLFDLGVSGWSDRDPARAGIGLYLAKAEADEIGASIAVTSPRFPTTFTIVLPLQR